MAILQQKYENVRITQNDLFIYIGLEWIRSGSCLTRLVRLLYACTGSFEIFVRSVCLNIHIVYNILIKFLIKEERFMQFLDPKIYHLVTFVSVLNCVDFCQDFFFIGYCCHQKTIYYHCKSIYSTIERSKISIRNTQRIVTTSWFSIMNFIINNDCFDRFLY